MRCCRPVCRSNEFYGELVATQRAIYRKHIDWRDIRGVAGISTRLLLRGQTNFVKSLFKLNSVYRTDLLLADHQAPVKYEIPLQPSARRAASRSSRPAAARFIFMRRAAAPPGDRRRDRALCRRDRMGATP